MLSFKQFITETSTGTFMDAKDHPLYKERSEDDIKPKSQEQMLTAVNSHKDSKRIMAKNIEHPEGTKVGARLNLNVLKKTGVPVQTIHKGKPKGNSFGGAAQSYANVVHLKNATFHVGQRGRELVSSDVENKHPLASVDGNIYHPEKPNFNGVEGRFNPKNTHLFIDNNGHAVKSAEDVTVHGHRVYMRGKIEYHTKKTAPKRGSFVVKKKNKITGEITSTKHSGDAPSIARIKGEDEPVKESIKEQTESTFDVYFGS